MATQAEVRDLIAKVRARGYKVTKSGTKHYKVLQANGAIVKDDNGPMIISATPSDANWRDMAVQRMRRVGIFDGDPYAPTRGKKGPAGTAEEDGDRRSLQDKQKERDRMAVTAAARRRGDDYRKRSHELRYRIERMVVKFGGWSTVRGGAPSTRGVSVADFMRAARDWDDAHDRLWPNDAGKGPATTSAGQQILGILRKPDSTVGARWMPLFEGFVDHLYGGRDLDDPAQAALRLGELIAAAKGEKVTDTFRRSTLGIPVEPGAGPAEIEAEIEPDPDEELEARVDVAVGVLLDGVPAWSADDLPDLAFRALYYMARGHEEASLNEREQLIAMAKEIAVLELKGREQ